MKNAYLGRQLRRLRENHGMTQAALARALELSPSYLNQIERNQRPLTLTVLARLDELFGTEALPFHEAGDGRLTSRLRAALADQGVTISTAELHDLADNSPALAKVILDMRRRLRNATERADLLAEQVSGQPDAPAAPTAFEAVRDYFYTRRNHIDELDRAAEPLGTLLPIAGRADALTTYLADRHRIRVEMNAEAGTLRRFDPQTRILHVASHLSDAQQAFQIGTQLALLEEAATIDRLCQKSGMSPEDQPLLRIGLANYYAGALILPYAEFLSAAEATRYDIELLARRFGVGFETTCHRLSTLQRSGESGVPFFFIRVDRAGNISKRQSATDFHFSRFGGSCPLWTIYDAFSRPGEVLRQVAQMPDGRRYLWVARTVSHGGGRFGAPVKNFAVALGCDIAQAERLVYAEGLDLLGPDAATPIGPGCKLCDRPACPQRAFPMIGQPIAAQPGRTGFAPYSSESLP
ncbi:MAG TPA: short-chain fatty acyl-CoA regulator family protein [Paracoccus sp. (in: a-proteobacteria)]|uniref:short-chain fatty acyl-CoA regulator family protein n=1 Tax=uncultured Paracoccus sp. TaxID=189685 RepID=UPI0026211CD8|nr:short-chain fatty acyl-CoA regulator family protein [uncultured Paracoccus sp.]HMQ41070.1 short-chain fatty acyl-CoA regulator family protein [Paracoccus sp. (in: a-proteobacteria)]HMR34730.1 short-chain fatty acyl-CoA regulator family protein [Paracoccus sp. (in: a-proteobacteria)]